METRTQESATKRILKVIRPFPSIELPQLVQTVQIGAVQTNI